MLQTQFTRCKTLLRTHENSERSSEHETRPSMSYLVTSPEHDQDMNKLTITNRIMYSKRSTETHLKECEELTGTKFLFRLSALQLPLLTTRGFKAAKIPTTLDD